MWKVSYKKRLRNHIQRNYHQNESNSNVTEKPKIENVDNDNNNRRLLVGVSFADKSNLMLKILSRLPRRDVYNITKSSPEQYSNTKIKIKEIAEENKPLSEYENDIRVLDDILGSSNRRYEDQFFERGRLIFLNIFHLLQFYFDLPKRSIRSNSDKIILFNETLKIFENIYRDVGGYDMFYHEVKELGRKPWQEEHDYFCIDRSLKKDQGRYCICNESKITYIEWTT